MGAKYPKRNLHREDEERKAKRALGIAPSGLVVAIGEVNCAEDHSAADHNENDSTGALGLRALVRILTPCRCPRPKERKRYRFSMQGRGFHSQRTIAARPGSSPRSPGVGGRERVPNWVSRRERLGIESCRVEQWTPIDWPYS